MEMSVRRILGTKITDVCVLWLEPMQDHPNQSPLHEQHMNQEAFFLPYGSGEVATQVVETFGDLDMEYAAIRKGCVIFDQPHIGTIQVRGAERGAFLNNMLTAKMDDLEPGDCKRAFWLNRKGRIDADLRLAQREDDMIIAVDRHLCDATAKTLTSFIFAEDAEIENVSERYHRMSIHGPTSCRLIELASTEVGKPLDSLDEFDSTHVVIAGSRILIEREDLTGEIGLELCIDRDVAIAVYDCLNTVGAEHPELKARVTGWLAINAARIEAGHPMFNIDFGDSNLPVESGIIEDRVSYTKGCYLGQEVVARMHARNVCAKRIVALCVEGERITAEQQEIHQPTGGSQIFEPGKEGETPIGNVTSSTISPMLGAVPICFAMVKEAFTKPGTSLTVSAEGKLVPCTVQDSLAFWKKASAN
jgi:folate-binding protein YgfZ